MRKAREKRKNKPKHKNFGIERERRMENNVLEGDDVQLVALFDFKTTCNKNASALHKLNASNAT